MDLYFIRCLISISALLIGAYQDLKTREIEDLIWLFMFVSAIFIDIAEFWGKEVNLIDILLLTIVQSGFFFLLHFIGAYGGADAKCLACLSFMFPEDIDGLISGFREARLTIPASTFSNAIFLSLSFIPLNLLINLISMARGIELFKGIKGGPCIKLLALLLLRKVPLEDVFNKPGRFLIAEIPSESANLFRLTFTGSRLEEIDRSSYPAGGYVFAVNLMPFLVFILLGFVLRVLNGDLLLSVAFSMAKSFTED